MSVESLCEQLILLEEGEERERLLAEAAASVECLDYLLATSQQQMGTDPLQAQRHAALAGTLAERRREPRKAAFAWRTLGQAYRATGRHAEASAALETASGFAQQAGEPLLAAQALIGRVDSLGWLGHYEEALALAKRLETELRALHALEDAAKVLVNLGSLYYRRDQYETALDCYARAQEVFNQAGEPVAAARVQANIANVLMELNRVEEALRLFEQARDVFARAGLQTPAAMVDANIGFLHYLSGRHGAAVAALSRARQEFAGRSQMLEAAKCEADMAEAYRELNLHPEALAAYESAIRYFESVAIDYERARAEIGRASVLMAMARFDEAQEGLERAQILFRTHKNSVRVAHVRLQRAYLLRAAGQAEEAEEEARKAAAALKRRRLHGWAAEARFLSVDRALTAGENVTRVMQAVSRTARIYARGGLEVRAERALGRYHAAQGARQRALKHFRRGVEALEQARTLIAPEEMHVAFLRDKLAIYEDMVGALLDRGRPRDVAEALEHVERAKSRLLLERVQTAVEGRAAGRSLTPEIEERLSALRAELSRGYHRLHALDEGEARRFGMGGTQEAESLLPLEKAYRAALQEAEWTQTPSQAGSAPLPQMAAASVLQTGLQSEEALLEFYAIQDEVCAFVITPQQIRIFRNIASLSEIAYQARRLRYQIQRAGWGRELTQRHAKRYNLDIQSVLARLYDLLLRPLQEAVTAEKIVIIPYSSLHGLPFHALFDGEKYALERWEFVYAPSAAVWHESVRRRQPAPSSSQDKRQNRAGSASLTALLIGVPEPGIEKVAEEMDRLEALLPQASALRGEEATLESFQAQAGCCRIIHLATHALYRSDNPLFSGLRFADGWLLARDLYEMTLDCDLATLSACQTGVAFVEAGDELFGLQRGFLAAGARSVAASLWPADDAATALLMEQFYTHLTQGMSKAVSLRAAQRSTLCHYPHPYHWAAFILIGER